MAGPYLPESFDRKSWNIMEKLNISYKTWEFQLYTFGLAFVLLYNTLPKKYWINYCQLIHAFWLVSMLNYLQWFTNCLHTLLHLGTWLQDVLLSTSGGPNSFCMTMCSPNQSHCIGYNTKGTHSLCPMDHREDHWKFGPGNSAAFKTLCKSLARKSMML